MNFYIRHKSDLPYLDLKIDSMTHGKELLLNSEITCQITTYDKCKFLIKCGIIIIIEEEKCNNCTESFFLRYKIPKIISREIGKYRFSLKIKSNENGNSYILPLKEDIIINVI